jgi:ribosomal protein L40E
MTEEHGPWICPKCQAKNDPDFSYCRLCGEKNPEGPPAEVACASCGAKHPGNTCCPLCGSKEFLQL